MTDPQLHLFAGMHGASIYIVNAVCSECRRHIETDDDFKSLSMALRPGSKMVPIRSAALLAKLRAHIAERGWTECALHGPASEEQRTKMQDELTAIAMRGAAQ